MSHARQVQSVDGGVRDGKDAGEIPLGNQNNMIAPRQPALNFTEAVIERRQGKFQHDDGIVGTADFLEQLFEVLGEFRRLGPTEHVVAADLQKDECVGDLLGRDVLFCRTRFRSAEGQIDHVNVEISRQERRPRIAALRKVGGA